MSQSPGHVATMDGAVEHYRAASGLGATLLARPGSRRFAAALIFKTGFRYDPDDAPGLSHLIEHLMMEGEARAEGDRLSRRGVTVNAWTTLERTGFWVSGPIEALDDSLRFLLSKLRPGQFTSQDLTREVAIIEQEQIGRGYSGWDAQRDVLFGILAGAKNNWLGTISDIQSLRAIAPERVNNFAHERFAPANAWLVIVSDGSEDRSTLLPGESTTLAAPENWSGAAEQSPPELPPFLLWRYRKAPQAWVSVSVHYRPYNVYRGTAVAILCEVLGAAPHGRIFTAVRTAGGMGYDQGLTSVMLDDCCLFNLYAMVEKRHVTSCLDALNGIVEDLRARGLSAEEFEESRARWRHGFESLVDDPQNICGFFAERVLHDERPPASPWDALASFDRLTLEETNEVAARLFRPERCLPAVIGKVGWWTARRLCRRLERGSGQ